MLLHLFEGVGEVDLQAVVGLEAVGEQAAFEFGHVLSGELHAELEVSHGVGGHEQLEAEEARQKVVVDVVVPETGAALLAEPLADRFDDFVEECAGAGSRVKDERAVALGGIYVGVAFFIRWAIRDRLLVSETVLDLEAGLEQLVNGPDDVADYGFRGVIHPTAFAKGGVVGGEEGFVKVEDRVLAGCGLAKVFQDFLNSGVLKDGDEFLHETGVGFIVKVGAGDGVAELAKQRVGAGDFASGLGEVECAAGAGLVAAGGKAAVGEGLRVEVCELGRLIVFSEVWDQRVGEDLPKVLE
ncbi:UNVERIFIED_CONTAM: hypothetical protein BEN50_24310 [Euhalothece sp. KZN 001]